MPQKRTDRLSLADYARSHGVSPQAATKWRSRGILVMVDGRVDVAASDRRMRDAGQGRYGKAVVGSIDAVEPAAIDPNDGEGVSRFLADLTAGRFRSQADAAAIKENALAAKHLLAARRESGQLVEMEVAEQALFEATRSIRDAWMNWPSRVGPLLAADLGVDPDRLVDALAAAVYRQLADLGEPQADFTGAA